MPLPEGRAGPGSGRRRRSDLPNNPNQLQRQVEVAVESWSGDPNYRPDVFANSVAKIRSSRETGSRHCVRVNVVSLGDGLARIKLKTFEGPDREEILEHQFIAIWMRLGTPSLDEVGATDPTGGPVGSESEVGDPAGDGQFLPSSRNGRVQVMVTGSFPHPLGAGGRFTLPADWATIAAALATDADHTDDDPAMRWDIHDDMLKTEGHVPGDCGPGVATVDAVDTCLGGDDLGPFSRVFGDLVAPSAGPFDPQRPATLLSDGKLDAGDAPMPAARVDVRIAANTPGGIGGAGALEKADKTEVYSRDGNGSEAAHNLYAPFYVQWLPATAAEEVEPAASGTDWFESNNFPGAPFGPYDNWDTFSLTEAVGTDTGCNRTVGFDGEVTTIRARRPPATSAWPSSRTSTARRRWSSSRTRAASSSTTWAR